MTRLLREASPARPEREATGTRAATERGSGSRGREGGAGSSGSLLEGPPGAFWWVSGVCGAMQRQAAPIPGGTTLFPESG